MNSALYQIVLILSISHFLADPILPSYDRDEGDWPVDVIHNMDNAIDRWFIDTTDAKCKPLEYRGVKGNYNNFASKLLCEMHGQFTQREKLQGCKMQMHPGHCVGVASTSGTEKYYFDQTTARCVSFQYNGCGGSFNRYDNNDECLLYCFNKKNGGLTDADDTIMANLENKDTYLAPNALDCDLRPDVKDKEPSTGIIAMRKEGKNKCAFAAVSKDSNTRGIFETFAQCVKTCFPYVSTDTGADKPEQKRRVAACDSDPHQIVLTAGTAFVYKYYHDKTNKVCKRMMTGPNPDNALVFNPLQNNFPTMEMCHSYCGAENYKKEIQIEEACIQPVKGEVGVPASQFSVKRYYYTTDHKCKAFIYQGFGGNTNNFASGDQCKAMCSGHYNEGKDVTTVEI